jgi:hypothetical protein
LTSSPSHQTIGLGATKDLKLATQEIDKKLGDAYPNGLVAEIEDIKARLSRIEVALILAEPSYGTRRGSYGTRQMAKRDVSEKSP